MKLQDLLNDIYDGEVHESYADLEISSICSDSRKLEKNGLFVALAGGTYNGNDFIHEVINKGVRVIVTDQALPDKMVHADVCFLRVENSFQFLRDLAYQFYKNPSNKLRSIGITGTNGKTTICYLIESILHGAGASCGVIGTINYRIGADKKPAHNTTPAFLDNQQLLSQMVDQGVDYAIMEVSSHALDQGRVDLIDFKAAVFTNLTKDHLDYHKTQENYFQTKAKLFINLSSDAASVINIDDVYGRKLISKTQSKVVTYGIENNAQVMAKDIQMTLSGTTFKLCTPEGEMVIRTALVGNYNVYNILAAVAVCTLEGVSLDKIRTTIENVRLVPGRLENINVGGNYSIFVDYAHTPDALENVLRTIRYVSDSKIILIFGCGGDRDKTKRPEMGRIANQLADFSIVTSDNPRSEDPQLIIDQIIDGFEDENYKVIVGREEAIQSGLNMAEEGDIVLITGKGHETYQIFKDGTIKFDERQVIRNYFFK